MLPGDPGNTCNSNHSNGVVWNITKSESTWILFFDIPIFGYLNICPSFTKPLCKFVFCSRACSPITLITDSALTIWLQTPYWICDPPGQITSSSLYFSLGNDYCPSSSNIENILLKFSLQKKLGSGWFLCLFL